MSIVRQILSVHRRFAGPWGDYLDGTIPPPTVDGAGGVPVSERLALQLIDAYACVSLLSDSVSTLPLGEHRRQGDVRVRVDPPSTIVDRPDPEIERWDYLSRLVTSAALRGNAYSVHTSFDSTTQLPESSQAVHPDDITKIRDRDTGTIVYRLRTGEILPAWQVMHIPLVTTAGSLTGLSPIECARRGIRLASQTETFGERWFAEGAAPSSVLETDQEMDDGQARREVAKWVASHGGRRRPALLSGGLKWRPISITPNESQFLESRKLNTSQIARLWRIPPHMIGDVERSTSWGSGIEEQGIGFVVYTLGPYLHRIETALSRLTPRGRYVRFNVAGLLRGNTRDRYLAYAIGRQWGWLSVDDIRRLEDMPPLPDGSGDTYLQPLNMIDASKALDILLQPKGA